jgi:Cu/Zn superoxide dismutase
MARKASKVMQQLPAHASTKFLGGTVRPITKAALGGVVGCALVMGGAGVASGALSNILKIQGFSEDLTMTPSTVADEVFDSARAKITIDKETDSITTFTVRITGIDPSAAGQTFGSHLHSGPCIEGSGASAGPHYNHDAARSISPAGIGPETEVWFDLVPDEDGMAYDATMVRFVPVDPDGVMSVVVHQLPTNPTTGAAGTRQACFPAKVSQLFPTALPSPTPTE